MISASSLKRELPSPRTFADRRKRKLHSHPLSFSFSHGELYLLTSDVLRDVSPRCLVYIHDGRVYNLVGAGSDLQREIKTTPLYNSICTEIASGSLLTV